MTYSKIEGWGEWDFLARGIETSRGYVDILLYDGVDRRIQVEHFDYISGAGDPFRELSKYLSGNWDVISVDVEPPYMDRDIELEGHFYWEEEDEKVLEQTDFRILARNLFGMTRREFEDYRIDTLSPESI